MSSMLCTGRGCARGYASRAGTTSEGAHTHTKRTQHQQAYTPTHTLPHMNVHIPPGPGPVGFPRLFDGKRGRILLAAHLHHVILFRSCLYIASRKRGGILLADPAAYTTYTCTPAQQHTHAHKLTRARAHTHTPHDTGVHTNRYAYPRGRGRVVLCGSSTHACIHTYVCMLCLCIHTYPRGYVCMHACVFLVAPAHTQESGIYDTHTCIHTYPRGCSRVIARVARRQPRLQACM